MHIRAAARLIWNTFSARERAIGDRLGATQATQTTSKSGLGLQSYLILQHVRKTIYYSYHLLTIQVATMSKVESGVLPEDYTQVR
jgi:hypothetical protein